MVSASEKAQMDVAMLMACGERYTSNTIAIL